MKRTLFETSFPVSGIMCYEACGATINQALTLEELKQNNHLPKDAVLRIDAEAEILGIHRLIILIESKQTIDLSPETKNLIATQLRKQLEDVGYPVIDLETKADSSNRINWLNILINLLTIVIIISLSLLCPPSIALTVSLSTLSVLTSTFTARNYIIQCINNLRNKQIATMASSITLGWLLSLSHTLYHSILMPLTTNFSMIFMSYIMPIMLIGIINCMDEIKRLVMKKSQNMHLKGLRSSLFPQMSNEYLHYPLSAKQQQQLSSLAEHKEAEAAFQEMFSHSPLDENTIQSSAKNLLQEGMLIKIKHEACFPVDGFIVQGRTAVDNSLSNGELHQSKHPPDFIPAGAINLGEEVLFYSLADSYHSSLNKLLFQANRSQPEKTTSSQAVFHKLYTALIVLSLIAALVTPIALGILSLPMLLQNVTGILFTVCPCTITIAHQLPILLSRYNRGQKGILLREDSSTKHYADMHTVIFDKTGTLTTGKGEVAVHEGISQSLWQRIYLLEKYHGGIHPLAQAITSYCEHQGMQDPIIKDISELWQDPQRRGLSAKVQGKQLHIGNLQYIQEQLNSELPHAMSLAIQDGLNLGYTPIYVAEDKQFQGIILIKQEIRTDVLASLKRLKNEGKQLILLTGDTPLSAEKFNQQIGELFEKQNIFASQKPADKEAFLKQFMASKQCDPRGVWFVGDGLNDTLCARSVSEKGGMSCSISSTDKAAYFTDISLNGTLEYLFRHKELNHLLKTNIHQNQWIISFSSLSFLAFVMVCSIVGIAVLPLIPLGIMVCTTALTLFNSYRAKLAVDIALDKGSSWLKRCFASDLSLALVMGASALFICALLLTTLATGGLALPVLAFTAGALTAVSSSCLLGACLLFGLFISLTAAYIVAERCQTDVCIADIQPLERPKANLQYDEVQPLPSSKQRSYTVKPQAIEKEDNKLQERELTCMHLFKIG